MRSLITLIAFTLLSSSFAYAQFDLLNKVKEKAKERIERKTDEAIDKGMDEAEEELTKEDKEQTEERQEEDKAEDNSRKDEQKQAKGNTPPELKSFTKFDFIPGEEILFFDDFSQDNIGDFPVKWNTSGTGEVVTLSNYPGKWFKLKNSSGYITENTGKFSENFTIEFDLINTGPKENNEGQISFSVVAADPSNPPVIDPSQPYGDIGAANLVSQLEMRLESPSRYFLSSYNSDGSTYLADKEVSDMVTSANTGTPIHVSIAVNKQRYRIWYNEKKIFDMPRAVAPAEYNKFWLGLWFFSESSPYEVLISNVRIAKGSSDFRSKLVTEGRLVTHGITFDSGSDKIKPESYGTLKEIAQSLKENPSIRVKILGHTDSDGSDALNLELSRKRSASVKRSLTEVFGIEASRMDTDGKGESEPMGTNDTPEGKAGNRRVEFVKL